MSDATTTLARLRAPDSPHLAALARLTVEDALTTPIAEVATPRWMASQLATFIEAATHGPALRDFIERRLADVEGELSAERRSLSTWVPSEVDGPVRDLLKRPWTPDPELTLRMIDQVAFHDLLREVIGSSLRSFSDRARDFDKRALGGLGKQAKRLGKGLFGGAGRNFSGTAAGLMGAVSEEFEGMFERRLEEFLNGATHEALKVATQHLCDPAHADMYGRLRVSILDVMLETPLSEIASEAEKLGPMETVDVVIAALRSIVSSENFVERTEQRIAAVLDRTGDGTLGAWLDEVELRDVWVASTTELLSQRLHSVARTEAFEAWWTELHAP